MRVNFDLRRNFKVIWVVQSPRKKYFAKSALPARPVLSRQEGRIAIVTNAGWDAVDAAALGAQVCSQGGFRERAAGAQDERRYSRTAKPCGPDARCWRQVRGGMSAQPGSDEPSIR